MLKVTINSSFFLEKEYVLKTLLVDFLGLDITIELDQFYNTYNVILPNKNKLIIEDHFFSKIKDEALIYKKLQIPSKVVFGENEFTIEKNIPIIYGNPKIINKRTNENYEITSCIDIISSCFFMLLRWEECNLEKKCYHSKFPYFEIFLFKNGSLSRSIVDEYIDALRNVFRVYEKTLF
jgi:hypothetical protein